MTSYRAGDRVKILPHTDQFMMGERYGRVTSVRSRFVSDDNGTRCVTRVYVRGERSRKRFRMRPDWIERADP